MDTYRIRLTMSAPTATPWQADTLWGHLCWAIVRQQGEHVLHAFLDTYRRGEPDLVLSDGFPAGFLPRPFLPLPPGPPGGRREAVLTARRAKAAASTLLPIDAFLRLCRGEAVPPAGNDAPHPVQRHTLALRNQIDRRSDSAGGDAGALYSVAEYHIPTVELYARVAPGRLPLLDTLLGHLAVEGYGKRRVVGYGAVADAAVEPFDAFDTLAGADAFVSLSRFVPAAGDPVDGMWRTAVKSGTVGGETATPFKRPLVTLAAGSWFRTPGGARPWYGRLVSGISRAHPNVVQYGLAFAVPIRAPSEVQQ
jgi:CRISPR-associated protein Csm4